MTAYVVSDDGFLPSAIILRDQRGMSLPAKPGAQSRLSPDARSKRELCHGQTSWPSAYLRPPGPLVRERPRCGQRLRAAHNESPAKPTTTDVLALQWFSPAGRPARDPVAGRAAALAAASGGRLVVGVGRCPMLESAASRGLNGPSCGGAPEHAACRVRPMLYRSTRPDRSTRRPVRPGR